MQNIERDISQSIKSAAVSFLKTDEIVNLNSLIDALEKIYTSKALGMNIESSDEESANRLIRIVIPLESELYHLRDFKENEIIRAYSVIALIFEYAARIKSVNEYESQQFWIRASLAYLFAKKSANSIVCAERARHPLGNQSDVQQKVIDLILSFLTRNLSDVKLHSTSILSELKIKVDEEIKSLEEQSLLFGLVELTQTIRMIAEFLQFGKSKDFENWQKHLDMAMSHFQNSGEEYFVWLISRLTNSISNMLPNALWNLKHMLPLEIIQTFTQNTNHPIYDLWDNQVEALSKIIVPQSPKHFSLIMPTSGGKTVVAAIVIAKELLEHKGNCFYVTPFKALVSEVAEFLKKYLPQIGINVSYLPGKYDAIPELDDLVGTNARLFVLTPEKLDLLWRTSDPRVKDSSIFIFDEIQNIVEEGRGLRLELLVSKIKKSLGHYARIILLSAVIPESNLVTLTEWLGSQMSGASKIDWKPTRTLEAVYWRARAEDNRADLHYLNKFNIIGILPSTIHYTRRDDAVQLALKYEKHLGPVLVYCNSRDEAEKTAELIHSKILLSATQDGILEKEASYAESILGNNVLLPSMMRSGVAYHHASLPDPVKKSVEELGRTGHLRIICCTSTLAEGVNLNVGTVIISSIYQGQVSMDGLKIRNLAGRAGRALKDTEGHVILMEMSAKQALTNDAYARFESRLFQYLSSVSNNSAFDTDIDAVESDLLARFYKKELTENNLDSSTKEVLLSTLFARQSNVNQFQSVLSNVNDHARRVISIPGLNDIQLKVFAETGLGIRHCQSLDSQAKNFANGPKMLFRINNILNLEIIRPIIDHSMLPSSRYGSRIQDVITDPISIIEKWIMGKSLLEISSTIEEMPTSKTLRRVTQFLYGYVSEDLSWTTASLTRLIESYLPENSKLDYEFYLLPSYLKYGVSNPSALLLCLAGLEDRDFANKISENSPLIIDGKSDWIKIICWALGLNEQKLSKIQENLVSSLGSFSLPLSNFSGKPGICTISSDGTIVQEQKPVGVVDSKYTPILRVLIKSCSIKIITKESASFVQIDPS